MKIPVVDLSLQYLILKDEIDRAIADTMVRSAFIGGESVKEFEKSVAEYCGTKYAVSCGNGTDALFLILASLGIGPGDEVITSPFTFFATVESIVHVGAKPVFVDIEAGTYNLDVLKIEEAITAKTRAIMPVHIFGQCVDMDTVTSVASKYGLLVVEDACQAIGATYKEKRAGSLGNAAAFSFFPSKNLGCAGDGGMITTDDESLAGFCRKMANHGTDRKYYHSTFGTNSRLDALQAAILSVRLPYLDSWNAQRHEAALYYDELLFGSGLELPVVRDYGSPVHHLYIVKAESPDKAKSIIDALGNENIGSALYYPLCLHEQEALKYLEKPCLPVAESCNGRTLALPLYPGITNEQQERVVAVLKKAL